MFFRYLKFIAPLQSERHTTDTVNKVSKLFHFVQERRGMDMSKSDINALHHLDSIQAYFARLSNDLEGKSTGYALQPSAFKNELQAFDHFQKFAQSDLNLATTDKALYTSIRTNLHQLICQLKKVNSRDAAHVDLQRIEHQQSTDSDLDFRHFLDAFTANVAIQDRVRDIMLKYGSHDSSVGRNDSEEEYRFFTRYLVVAVFLCQFQRPGVAKGFTVSNFLNAKSHDGKGYLISISDHKNRTHSLANVIVPAPLFKALNIYFRRFRQPDINGAENSVKFFRTWRSRKPIPNVSKEIKSFQLAFGLPTVTCTENRHAVESRAVTVATPDQLLALESMLNHSSSTAKRYYRGHANVSKAYKDRHQVSNLLNTLCGSSSGIATSSSGTEPSTSVTPPSSSVIESSSSLVSAIIPLTDTASLDSVSVSSRSSGEPTGSFSVDTLKNLLLEAFPPSVQAKCPTQKEALDALKDSLYFRHQEGLFDETGKLTGDGSSLVKKCTSHWRERKLHEYALHFLEHKRYSRDIKFNEVLSLLEKAYPELHNKEDGPGVFSNRTNVVAKHFFSLLRKREHPTGRKTRTMNLSLQTPSSTIMQHVQLQTWPGLFKKGPLPNRGFGVFTTQDFNKGDLVIDYGGCYRTGKEGDVIYKNSPPEAMGYMFNFKFGSSRHYRDATYDDGKLGRLMNHSKCCFNVKGNPVDFDRSGKPIILFTATRDIGPNEELLFDYNDAHSSAEFLSSCPRCQADDPLRNDTCVATTSVEAPVRPPAGKRQRRN